MYFTDTHTHLYAEEFSADIDTVIQRAIQNKVTKLFLPDIDTTVRNSMLELSRKYPDNCFPMIGLHPTSVKDNYKEELSEIEKNISAYKFYGIGETGIDLYWDKNHIREQMDAFTFHIELAIRFGLAVIIHSRKSLNEIFTILKNYENKDLTGVFHCFPGNIKEARHVADMGFYLGIGGVVTYKNSTMAEVVKQIDIKHIVLETDAPYLAPVPLRGKRNESSNIPLIANFIAQLKNISTEEVAEHTSANAKKLFGI
ncbi:MAG TPA: TatD family hydrolase [Bacteroidales bacterium]|nr:TatD family hydrolase [Bacteroidales bacterium]